MEAWTERNTGTRSHSGVGYIKYEKYNITPHNTSSDHHHGMTNTNLKGDITSLFGWTRSKIRTNIIIFIRRFFATTKIGRRNQENGWEPQGFARTARRPWNALALMVTLWQGRPAKLQSTLTRSLASVDSNWIKTLRLQSNGTKSCDFFKRHQRRHLYPNFNSRHSVKIPFLYGIKGIGYIYIK